MPRAKATNNNAHMIHRYLQDVRHSRGRSEATMDQIAASLADFLEVVGGKDFHLFKPAWAIKYKEVLDSRISKRTGTILSQASIIARLQHLESFFAWLSEQQSYRSRICSTDVSYFKPSLHSNRAAVSRPRRQIPTIEQLVHIMASMPIESEIGLRNRALIAFILLTGARADAAASFALGNLNIGARTAFFDGRTSRTKNRKGYTADFFPVGEIVEGYLIEWERYLRVEKLFGNGDPLFPATRLVNAEGRLFDAAGLSRTFWKSSEPVRRIFKEACEAAGLPYFNPHSVRTTIGLLGQKLCKTAEEVKVWSQNMGHESVDTTFRNYGHVNPERQAEIMKKLRRKRGDD
jgi:integrase